MIETSLRSVEDLKAAGLVAAGATGALDEVAARYAIALTPTVANQIDPNDPDDPIAAQYVPQPAELIETEGERADPIGDHAQSPLEGILHR